MNPADQKMIAAAVTTDAVNPKIRNKVAISSDRGTTFTINTTPTTNFISNLAFSADGTYLYINTVAQPGSGFVNTVYRCPTAGTWGCTSIGNPALTNYVQQIAVDENDNTKVFVLGTWTESDYRFPTVSYYDGSAWTDITKTGSNLDNAPMGGAIVYLKKGVVNTVVVATPDGIMIPNGAVGTAAHTNWLLIGDGLPNVPIMDMVYDSTDDVLVLAAMGRGIWYLKDASVFVTRNIGTPARFLGSLRQNTISESSVPRVDEHGSYTIPMPAA